MCLADQPDCVKCLKAEVADCHAMILNLLGKLDVTENTCPPFALDMASLVHLEVTHDERGVTAKRTVKNLGS